LANCPCPVPDGGDLGGVEPVMDNFTYEGAQRLAGRITDYWYRQGRKVQVWVARETLAGIPSVWVVRSDLVNGFPRS
jgi:hypothetical protein